MSLQKNLALKFGFKFELIVLALTLASFLGLSSIAAAETTRTVRKKQTTVTEVETEGEDEAPNSTETQAPPSSAGAQESELTTKFGSKATTGMAGCKTEELAKGVVRDLKADCGAWIKDQKTHLKSHFLTGTCEEECNECGMSLQRCTVNGTVRYTK